MENICIWECIHRYLIKGEHALHAALRLAIFYFFYFVCLAGHILCNMYTGASFFVMVALEYSMLEWLYRNLFKEIFERHLNCFQWFCYNKYCAMTTEFLCCCYSCARILIG